MICRNCEADEKLLCEFRGCMKEAKYEGWFSVLDPFTSQKTGLARKMQVCEDCKKFLNGSEKNDNPQA